MLESAPLTPQAALHPYQLNASARIAMVQAPVAPPQPIFARPLGSLQWQCPDCGCLHSCSRINIRRAVISCRHCQHAFKVGLGLSATSLGSLAPIEHLVHPHYLNHIDLPLTDTPSVPARIVGQIEWQCPHCLTVARWSQAVGWRDGKVICDECHIPTYVHPILYRTHRGIKHKTPHDWIPPLPNSGMGYVQTPPPQGDLTAPPKARQ